MKAALEGIKTEGLQALKEIETLDALESLRIEYFGRRGKLTDVMKGMGKLSKEERPAIGKLAN
ncbi:MAG: phenylalanine--tRNA ligase subunit alpha, partial [Candidatus Poribacteria bacterium]|nr:phenylalanine--tRNA ligase subunit alpha [Candidatus Poribacteria bacterium]